MEPEEARRKPGFFFWPPQASQVAGDCARTTSKAALLGHSREPRPLTPACSPEGEEQREAHLHSLALLLPQLPSARGKRRAASPGAGELPSKARRHLALVFTGTG